MTAAGVLVAAALAAVGWLSVVSLAVLILGMRRRLERAARAEHEIRGPLAALTLVIEQVRRGRSGSEIAGTLDAQLARASAGVGDLTRALAGACPSPHDAGTVRRAVSLEPLARHTAAGWSEVAARAGGDIRFDWRAGPTTVVADRGRLAQALGNLMSNAIEHGGGDIEVRGRQVNGAVRVEVSDGGVKRRGGPYSGTEVRDAPFDRRGPQARLGRGRGLAITRRAVEESGGTLEIVTGSPGTTAALELPVVEQ